MSYTTLNKAHSHHRTRDANGESTSKYTRYENGIIEGKYRDMMAVIADSTGFDGMSFDSAVGSNDDSWHVVNVFKDGGTYIDTMAVGGAMDSDHAMRVAGTQLDHLGGDYCTLITDASAQFDGMNGDDLDHTVSIDAINKLMSNPSQDRHFLPLVTAVELKEEAARVTFDSVQWDKEDNLVSHGGKDSRLYLDLTRADTCNDLVTELELADALQSVGAEPSESFDALMDTKNRLPLLKDRLFKAMSSAGDDELSVTNVTQTKEFKRQGMVNIAFVFDLSDGQKLSIWFHNPDSTPSNLLPSDIMISWKWMLNNRDLTAALSPKNGDNVQLPVLASRIMRVAAKNSKRFKGAQARKAKIEQELTDTQKDIDDKTATVEQLDSEIDELNTKIDTAMKAPKPEPKVEPVAIPEPATDPIPEPDSVTENGADDADDVPADTDQDWRDETEDNVSVYLVGEDKDSGYVRIRDRINGTDANGDPLSYRYSALIKGDGAEFGEDGSLSDIESFVELNTKDMGITDYKSELRLVKGADVLGVNAPKMSADESANAKTETMLANLTEGDSADYSFWRMDASIADVMQLSGEQFNKLTDALEDQGMPNEYQLMQAMRTGNQSFVDRAQGIIDDLKDSRTGLTPEIREKRASLSDAIRADKAPSDTPASADNESGTQGDLASLPTTAEVQAQENERNEADVRRQAEQMGWEVSDIHTADKSFKIPKYATSNSEYETLYGKTSLNNVIVAIAQDTSGESFVSAWTAGKYGFYNRLGEYDIEAVAALKKYILKRFDDMNPNAADDPDDLFSDDTANANAANPNKKVVKGKTNKSKTAKGTKIESEFALVDAKFLIASHTTSGSKNPKYPQELQPRDRTRESSIAWVQKTSKDLDPESLGRTGRVDTGAPIVGDDLVVESGNGRTMAIKMAYDNGDGTEYSEWLAENADMFGFNAKQVKAYKQPILVRVRTTDIDRSDFAVEANQDDKMSFTASERAKSDSKRINAGMLELFTPSDSGDLLAVSNQGFVKSFLASLGDTEAAQYTDSNGQPTQALEARMKAAIFSKAYDDDRLLEMMSDQAKPELQNMLNALSIAAPKFVEAQAVDRSDTQDIAEKVVDGVEQSLNDEVKSAIVDATNMIMTAKRNNQDITEFVKQQGLFEDIDDATAELAVFLVSNARSAKKMAEYFTAMAGYIEQDSVSRQTLDMFGEPEPISLADVIAHANGVLNNKGDAAMPEPTPAPTPDPIPEPVVDTPADSEWVRELTADKRKAIESVFKSEDLSRQSDQVLAMMLLIHNHAKNNIPEEDYGNLIGAATRLFDRKELNKYYLKGGSGELSDISIEAYERALAQLDGEKYQAKEFLQFIYSQDVKPVTNEAADPIPEAEPTTDPVEPEPAPVVEPASADPDTATASRIFEIEQQVQANDFDPATIDADELIALVDKTEGNEALSEKIEQIAEVYEKKLIAISMNALNDMAGT